MRCYLAAIRLDAQLPDAWNNLGIAYLTLHDEQAARQAWLLCRTLAPWRTDCLFNLADLATVTGDLQQAASLWEEFLRREPVGEVADHARHRLHALQAASAINRP